MSLEVSSGLSSSGPWPPPGLVGWECVKPGSWGACWQPVRQVLPLSHVPLSAALARASGSEVWSGPLCPLSCSLPVPFRVSPASMCVPCSDAHPCSDSPISVCVVPAPLPRTLFTVSLFHLTSSGSCRRHSPCYLEVFTNVGIHLSIPVRKASQTCFGVTSPQF